MKFNTKFSVAIQTVVALVMVAALAAACGGGSTASPTAGFSQAYTSSAGVGEVLQFSVDTVNMVYTYKVAGTSYAASGVTVGQSGSGALLSKNAGGTYNVGPSNDGFILAGKVLPIQNGLLLGHVEISLFGASFKVPVFGVSNPITSVAALADTYNFQGFGCSALGIANVLGNAACVSHMGTVTVAASGTYAVYRGCDVNGLACAATASGVLSALPAYPGVFDYRSAAGHVGWFFAFTAPNGQKIAVIDHDDTLSVPHVFGHTVLASYASSVSGAADGQYFVKNNEGGESLLTISGASLTDISLLGTANGTLTLNSPWPGMEAYQFASGAVSGVSMAAGAGVYTYRDNSDPGLFGVAIRYAP